MIANGLFMLQLTLAINYKQLILQAYKVLVNVHYCVNNNLDSTSRLINK